MLNEGYANEDEEFQVGAERTGPALNVKIKKSSLKSQCGRLFHKDEITALDADFTLALSCPKFPRDGKCKFSFYIHILPLQIPRSVFLINFSSFLIMDYKSENFIPKNMVNEKPTLLKMAPHFKA